MLILNSFLSFSISNIILFELQLRNLAGRDQHFSCWGPAWTAHPCHWCFFKIGHSMTYIWHKYPIFYRIILLGYATNTYISLLILINILISIFSCLNVECFNCCFGMSIKIVFGDTQHLYFSLSVIFLLFNPSVVIQSPRYLVSSDLGISSS